MSFQRLKKGKLREYDSQAKGVILIISCILLLVFNATALAPDISYEIGTQTVDKVGKINKTIIEDYSIGTITPLAGSGTVAVKGDLNGDGIIADAGDLAKMKDGSVGNCEVDWTFDLNENGINADAADLAMMRDASLGKLELITNPPLLTNVTARNITTNSAIISWNTDKLSDSMVKYGTAAGSYGLTAYDPTNMTPHNITLTGLSALTTYYFVVNSTDRGGNSNESAEYTFTTRRAPNNLPNTPSNPSPVNHLTGQSIDVLLSWTGGDPDAGDTVTYDVYFGTSSSPPLVSNDQPGTTFDPPSSLSYNTKYYWKINATDNHGASTSGPTWDFTTTSATPTQNQPGNSSKLINITHVNATGETFTNFPAFINVTKKPGMQADYDDVGFWAADDSVEYARELDNYTASYALFWVNITTFAPPEIQVKMYYDNDSMVATDHPSDVWDSHYIMVQHMNDVTTSTIQDSTTNNNDGTKKGANEPIKIQGLIGNEQLFDGSNDYINCGNGSSLHTITNAITLEAVIKTSQNSGYQNIVDKHSSNKGYNIQIWYSTPLSYGPKLALYLGNGASEVYQSSAYNIPLYTYMHYAAIWDNATDKELKLYMNGDRRKVYSSKTITGPLQIPNDNLAIGDSYVGGTEKVFNGTIDEVRLSNIARSQDWLRQTWEMMSKQDSYVHFAPETVAINFNEPTKTVNRLALGAWREYIYNESDSWVTIDRGEMDLYYNKGNNSYNLAFHLKKKQDLGIDTIEVAFANDAADNQNRPDDYVRWSNEIGKVLQNISAHGVNLKYIEIWNEPDYSASGNMNAAQYTELAATVIPYILGNMTNPKIIVGATSDQEHILDWLPILLANDTIKNNAWAFSYHRYRDTSLYDETSWNISINEVFQTISDNGGSQGVVLSEYARGPTDASISDTQDKTSDAIWNAAILNQLLKSNLSIATKWNWLGSGSFSGGIYDYPNDPDAWRCSWWYYADYHCCLNLAPNKNYYTYWMYNQLNGSLVSVEEDYAHIEVVADSQGRILILNKGIETTKIVNVTLVNPPTTSFTTYLLNETENATVITTPTISVNSFSYDAPGMSLTLLNPI